LNHPLLETLTRELDQLSETPYLDAQVLLAHILGKPRAWVLAHPEVSLQEAQHETLEVALSKLRGNAPLPYVLGNWEFYGLNFTINPSVLIPRPETESLVEQALNWLREHPLRRRAIDIGTGSGCIAISLAKHVSDLQVIATDISLEALEVARTNAINHAVADRVKFVCADLFSPIPREIRKPFDLICANLPYIPTSTLRTLDVFEREPTLALDGGADGLGPIRSFLIDVPHLIAQKGMVLLEIEASQGSHALSLVRKSFPGADVSLLPDLAGLDRLIQINTPAG
jgi:release factor glutamine methyltransferase